MQRAEVVEVYLPVARIVARLPTAEGTGEDARAVPFGHQPLLKTAGMQLEQ
ncbi:hypothetical protein D3C79_702560 [compost metagenome]